MNVINILYCLFLRIQKLNRGIVMVSFYADHIACSGNANMTHVVGKCAMEKRIICPMS